MARWIIGLVFGARFLFDTCARERNPVQYGFVGLALVIFFLLLLSLSETQLRSASLT